MAIGTKHSLGYHVAELSFLTLVAGAVALPFTAVAMYGLDQANLDTLPVKLAVKVGIGIAATYVVLRHIDHA